MTSRRGRVLKDTAHGDGIISIDGQQHRFTLEQHWRSDIAPSANMVVDCEFDDQNVLQTVRRVSDEQIAKEKAAQLSNDAMAGAKAIGGRLLGEAGTPAVVAFFAFLIGGLALSALTVKIEFGIQVAALHFGFYKIPCFTDLMSESAASGGALANLLAGSRSTAECSTTSGYSLVFLIAALLPLLPHFYKQKKEAWLAYAAPAALVLYICGTTYYYIHSQISEAREAQERVASQFGMMGGSENSAGSMAAKMYSIDFGLYIVIAAALVLAFIGIKKYLAESGKKPV